MEGTCYDGSGTHGPGRPCFEGQRVGLGPRRVPLL